MHCYFEEENTYYLFNVCMNTNICIRLCNHVRFLTPSFSHLKIMYVWPILTVNGGKQPGFEKKPVLCTSLRRRWTVLGRHLFICEWEPESPSRSVSLWLSSASEAEWQSQLQKYFREQFFAHTYSWTILR